jgi:hypothetical protein
MNFIGKILWLINIGNIAAIQGMEVNIFACNFCSGYLELAQSGNFFPPFLS